MLLLRGILIHFHDLMCFAEGDVVTKIVLHENAANLKKKFSSDKNMLCSSLYISRTRTQSNQKQVHFNVTEKIYFS